MSGPGSTRAVFLDALGTMVELEPPWIHLAAQLDVEVPPEQLVRAVKVEMAYYKEHSHEGRDEATLADLRGRCAALISTELGIEVTVEQLVASVRFDAYPDAAPALAALRARGTRLIAVSNWDVSLPLVLERCGLAAALDGAVTSAAVGALKPAPAIFEAALEVAGCEPAQALHIGDTAEEDVAGASAAGIRALLLDRDGNGDIASLLEIEDQL